MPYDKYADPIPKSNAKAQVAFWTMDLHLSIKYLEKVKSYKKYNFKFFNKVLTIAEADVAHSERELLKAQKKLDESYD